MTIRWSKTGQEGPGRKVGMPYGGRPRTCPVRAVRDWIDFSLLTEGPLFRPINRFGKILDGLRELKQGRPGRVINVPDVAKVREKTGLSQSRFADLLGVSVRTLQDWEQGRRAPSGAARTLLVIADRNPRALLDVA
jgi:putative transcriptional regulator